jgi:hypothetical protein
LTLQALLQYADLSELCHHELAHPRQPDAQDGERNLDFQERIPAPAAPGEGPTRCAAGSSPPLENHDHEPHWKFGTMAVARPACWTDPEKLPSDAMVKLPEHDADPERVAVAVKLLPSLETVTL